MSETMVDVFRHDAHKFSADSHEKADEKFAGIPVNQPVPEGADGDAANLSRPPQQQNQTVENHQNQYRLSLFTGDTVYVPGVFSQKTQRKEIHDLLAIDRSEPAHRHWLASDIASAFNESIYHPYTSLKYHTLLVAALLDNYREGHEFSDLLLVVDQQKQIVPFRTVFTNHNFSLHIDVADNGRPSARLGSRPWQSWASTWNRLTAHPLSTDNNKYDMTLDANLRRIQSWSTALQYIEDFAEWRPDR